MTPERWKKIESLFESALERDPAERAVFLDRECGGDERLRREVESLLAHQQPTGRFISTLAHDAARLIPKQEPLSTSGGRFIPGTVLASRYRIIGLLGRGGMGEVYRADDLKLAQPVALKFLPENLARDRNMLDRFHKEVRVARQISHPNVCRMFDIGEGDGQHFLSMEYIDGEDLATLLRRIGRLPSDKAVEIAQQLCAGLAAAHEEGVLHRDLKPANVMIDGRGRAKITDFGLAGLADEFQGHEVRAGTPAYMAPEQLSGKGVSVKSDIYSLGLVLYEIFTGKKAFEASTLEELIRQHETSEPPSISEHVKEVDPLVERVILKCLEREPAARPASAAKVAAALPGGDPLAAAIAAGETPSPEMVAAAPKKGSLRPAVAVALFSFFLLEVILNVVAFGNYSLHSRVPMEKPPEVLADRAATILKSLGHSNTPADSAYGFDYDMAYIRQIRDHDPSPARWERVARGRPAAIYFWYRQSQRHLVHKGKGSITVTADDPPPNEPGMINLMMTPQGQLIKLRAIAPQFEQPGKPSPPTDWSALFSLADLNIVDFKQADSMRIPPVYSDARAAWEGAYPDQPDIPIRIEAASYQGKPVYFEIIEPWSRPAETESGIVTNNAIEPPTRQAFAIFFISVTVIAVIASAALARRNLRQGRGDRKGAFRLAVFVFTVRMIGWAIVSSHVPVLREEMTLLIDAVAGGLFQSGMLWLFYIALEPHVRRKWPERLISWSRVLAGEFRDPMVGRDILIGGMVGTGIIILNSLSEYAEKSLGLPYDLLLDVRTESLLGLRGALENFTLTTLASIQLGLLLLFVLLLVYLIVRKEALTIGIAWLLLFAGVSLAFANSYVEIIYTLVASGMLIFVMMRFGLFAFMMAHFFLLHSEFYPYTAEFSAWYADGMIFALLVAIGLGLYGFYTSLAGQPLLRGGLPQD
ncbi:MAG TPA: serine/threonine-protein kinase [Blastocatellia bacterium]|nr:serine/threonine-protein kinase [Blastocatellia bacterium]